MNQEILNKMNDISAAMLDPRTSRVASMVADSGWDNIHKFTTTHGGQVLSKSEIDATEVRLGPNWREDIIGLFIDDMNKSIMQMKSQQGVKERKSGT